MKKHANPNAFTFIDLLVLLSVLTLLISLVLPAIRSNRRAEGEVTCMSQIRTYSQGMFLYQEDRGTMPAALVKQKSRLQVGLPAWFDLLKTEGFLGDARSALTPSCPLVVKDLPNFISATSKNSESDTRGRFTYSMNAVIGGWDSRPSSLQEEYDFKPINTERVSDPAWTVLVAELITPFTTRKGKHRRRAYIKDFGESGIPHIYETLNTSWERRGVKLQGRSGTVNFAFVDGSVRSIAGYQTDRVMVQEDFTDAGKLILNPFE